MRETSERGGGRAGLRPSLPIGIDVRSLIAVLAFFVSAMTLPQETRAETRVALVIGNSDYQRTTRLANPVNDAELIASILRRQGFDVLAHSNLGFKAMKRAISEFTTKLETLGRDTVGLVFYAGHGLQSEGINYLVPVDADIGKEGDIPIEAIDASSLLGSIRIAGNRLNIVILDACRNSPYEGRFRSSARGLARVDAPVGSLIAYSTAPGSVAADGDAANSPYTQALAAAMIEPGLKIEEVFKRARQKVYEATDGRQVPWESSSVFDDFYFQPVSANPQGGEADSVPGNDSVEIAFWRAVKDSGNAQLLQTYLDKYPQGDFAPIARTLIEQAKREPGSARSSDPDETPQSTSPAAGLFDGLWKIKRVSPSCRKKKGQYMVFKMRIHGDKILWGRGTGSVKPDGSFEMTSKVIGGNQGFYKGQIKGDAGNGQFFGKNVVNGATCSGTISLSRTSS